MDRLTFRGSLLTPEGKTATHTVNGVKGICIDRSQKLNQAELTWLCRKASRSVKAQYGFEVTYRDGKESRSLFVRFGNFTTAGSEDVFSHISNYFQEGLNWYNLEKGSQLMTEIKQAREGQPITPFVRIDTLSLEEQLANAYVQFHNKAHIAGTNSQYFGLDDTEAIKTVRRLSHELQLQLKAIHADIDARDTALQGPPLAFDPIPETVGLKGVIDWS